MLKLDLSDYRIVQDSFFPPGGASGGTGAAGAAEPLETHVYLETGESGDVAREMLDISEQTCFLHAFLSYGSQDQAEGRPGLEGTRQIEKEFASAFGLRSRLKPVFAL